MHASFRGDYIGSVGVGRPHGECQFAMAGGSWNTSLTSLERVALSKAWVLEAVFGAGRRVCEMCCKYEVKIQWVLPGRSHFGE